MLKTVAVAAFALSAVYGFTWMLWTMTSSSVGYFATLDASPASLMIAAGSVAMVAGLLYLIFYPEGQKA